MRKIIPLVGMAVGCGIAVQINSDFTRDWREMILGPELRRHVLTIAIAVSSGYVVACFRNRHDRLFGRFLVPIGLLALCIAMFAAQLQSGIQWPRGRWLYVGSFSIQPAEFLRLALAVAVVMSLSDLHRGRPIPWRKIGLLSTIGLLLLLEGDISTLLLLSVTIGSASYCWGQGRSGLSATALSLFATLLIMFVHTDNLRSRFEMRQDRIATDSQLGIVLTALHTSRVFGRATGTNAESIPLGTRDFFLARSIAIYGRFFGAVLFLICLAIPLLTVNAYLKQPHSFALHTLCICWAAFCCMETLLHASVNLALAPVLGVNLPFASPGGSAMAVYLGTFTFLCSAKDSDGEHCCLPPQGKRSRYLATVAELLSLMILIRLLTL